MKNYKLLAARKAKRWTITKAAEMVGVSPVTYSRWENGIQTPYLSTLDLLCKAHQMSPDDLGFPAEVPIEPGAGAIIREVEQTVLPVQAASTPLLPATDMFSVAIMGLILAQRQHNWTPDELRLQIGQKLEALGDMSEQSQKHLTRRDALAFLAGLPLAMSGLTKTNVASSPFVAEDILPLYSASIPACWNLWFAGEIAEVERVLPVCLSRLVPLAEQLSPHQKNAAGLASQAHQLAALVAKEVHEDFGASLAHCKQALLYGQVAQDQNLIAASFLREDDTLFYRKRDTLQVLEQAVHCTPDASPLMRGRIYVSLAASYAKHTREQEALRFLGQAQDTFPDHPENDPGFLYTHTDHYILYLDESILYHRLHRPQDAWEAITKASNFVPDNIGPRRAELLSQTVTASIALNDLEQSCFHFEKLATLGTTLGAELFISEAQTSYQEMQAKWPSETRVKALGEILYV